MEKTIILKQRGYILDYDPLLKSVNTTYIRHKSWKSQITIGKLHELSTTIGNIISFSERNR